MIKLERNEISFVLGEGLATFPALYAGEAVSYENSLNKAYKLEWVGNINPNEQPKTGMDKTGKIVMIHNTIVGAVSLVAKTFGGSNWERFIAGPAGRFKTLEEMPGRDPAKYIYAKGKYMLGLSMTISPASLKISDIENPANKAKFEEIVLTQAPGVTKFANPNNPTDLYKIEQMNKDNMVQGLPAILESEYHKTLIPVDRTEFWAGCYVSVLGHAFWDNKRGKGVLLGLDRVLMTRQGERLTGTGIDPDEAFAAFVPSQDLAPATDPWAKLL